MNLSQLLINFITLNLGITKLITKFKALKCAHFHTSIIIDDCCIVSNGHRAAVLTVALDRDSLRVFRHSRVKLCSGSGYRPNEREISYDRLFV